MNTERLKMINGLLQQATDEGVVSGMTAKVMKGGEEIFYGQAGLRDVENKLPMERDTIFRLYSMSKAMTSTAVMLLAQDGKLDLTSYVSDFFPNFGGLKYCKDGEVVPVNRPMSVKHLLNMTSGLTYGGDYNQGSIATSALIEEIKGKMFTEDALTTVDIAKRLGDIPVDFNPGDKFHYGLSADVLGAIVEVVSGQRFGDFLQERVFDPLGMKDTGFYVPEDKQYRLAKVYRETAEGTKLYTENHLGISNTMATRPAFESGGAGLVSTIDDYGKFALMLANGGKYHGKTILTPKMHEFMTTAEGISRDCLEDWWPHLGGHTYANLLRILKEPGRSTVMGGLGEFGWDGWLGTFMNVDPANDLVILVMMQKVDAGTIGYTRKIKNVVYSAL